MFSINFRIHLFLFFFQKKFGTLKKSCNFAAELNFATLLRYPARGGVSIYYTEELKKCYIFLQLFLIQYLNLLILTEKKFSIISLFFKIFVSLHS